MLFLLPVACFLLSERYSLLNQNFNFNVVSFLKVEGNEWVVLYVSYWKNLHALSREHILLYNL